MNQPSVLILPGWQNSGPQHWQSVWQEQNPAYQRIKQRDWDTPKQQDWLQKITEDVSRSDGPVVLVAHSLGCIAAILWVLSGDPQSQKVHGALLVAPADVDREDIPLQTKDFGPVPRRLLPYPSILVASSNDPYLSLERARDFAQAWGSQFFDIGPAGHINGESGLGDWPEGKRLLRMLL